MKKDANLEHVLLCDFHNRSGHLKNIYKTTDKELKLRIISDYEGYALWVEFKLLSCMWIKTDKERCGMIKTVGNRTVIVK